MTDLTLNGALGFDPLFQTFNVDEFDTSRAFARRSNTMLKVNFRS